MSPHPTGPSSSGRPPWRSSTSTAHCLRRRRRFSSPASSIAAAGFAARFSCRGLYHGLQHRFGRLGLRAADRHRPQLHLADSGRRARADRLRELRGIRAAKALRRRRRPSEQPEARRDVDRAGLVVARSGHPAPGHLSRMHRHADDARALSSEAGWSGSGRAQPATAKASATGPRNGRRATRSRWTTPSPTPTTGAIGACWNTSAERSSCTRAGGCCGWPGRGDGISSGPAGPHARGSFRAESLGRRRKLDA